MKGPDRPALTGGFLGVVGTGKKVLGKDLKRERVPTGGQDGVKLKREITDGGSVNEGHKTELRADRVRKILAFKKDAAGCQRDVRAAAVQHTGEVELQRAIPGGELKLKIRMTGDERGWGEADRTEQRVDLGDALGREAPVRVHKRGER